MELQQTLNGLMPLCFTADDVYHVFQMILKLNVGWNSHKSGFTPYARAMQDFYSALPAEHELCRSLSAREEFGRQVRELWTAHCAMAPQEFIQGVELYGMGITRP
jgi:hypothetical protein